MRNAKPNIGHFPIRVPTISLSINLAAIQLSGGADTSFETTLKANRRISNIEPQNVEVWNRFAQSLYKIDRIHYSMFDVGRSMFDVHWFLFFDQTGRFLASGRRSCVTTKIDDLDRQSSGGVYPRPNGGYRRFPPTNRLSEFIRDCRQALGGDKPRQYIGSPEEQV